MYFQEVEICTVKRFGHSCFTEEELKSDGCVLIHPDSESGYPKMYCGETDQFGIVPGSTCFGVKVFDRPGNSVSARVHTSDVWCSSETHYITPIITGDSDAADEFHTLGIAFAVVHPDGEIADVLSSYELGSFTLRTFDNSFWNGLAFGLRGVGVAAFKPSSSFERGYVAGSDLRNHRDMVSDENLEFGGPHYSYNGTELPILPANWDKEKYPYAIVLDMLGMKYLIVSSSLFATTGSGYTTTVTTDVAEYTFLKSDDKWRFDGYSTIEAGYNGYGTIKWSNTDIYKTDGSIYLAASDPVPVI